MNQPPLRNDGPYPPEPAYASTYYAGGVAPPPMAHQHSGGPNTNTYPARAERYTPPAPPTMSRPMSQYHPEGGGPRHGRNSAAYEPTQNASRVYGHGHGKHHRPKNNYGHLVNDQSLGAMPCSGEAWKGCCKYNVFGCLICFNGCMRLCGCGVSIMETLSFN
ncbi:hypothetical protein IWQ56_002672 [Coemansia nantahalensis]|uniref:Uncharacterized protein n=2 Tax=Coemansia TaxID=4863 RepID=A0ACC1KGM4_9FUNG|nr:hypothetical protein IWQ57_003518 [Coemansia nantahalensis]KAJ2769135.1 hypothetical protein IWQ56_002672 [Coemansia nantahalensis]KAJ2789557.1 hypothetical protein H4R21_006713 [Coemansia helicoidea]